MTFPKESGTNIWVKKHLSSIIKVIITVVILTYLGFTLDWEGLLAEFKQVNLVLFFLACLVYIGSVFFVTIRWQILLRIQGIMLNLPVTVRLTFIGLFFNTFLLGSAGGDLTKIYFANQAAPGNKALLLLSVVSDRLIGLLVLLMFTLVLIPFKLSALWGNDDTQSMIYLLAAFFIAGIAGLATIFLFPVDRLPSSLVRIWKKLPLHEVAETLLKGVREHGRAKNLTFTAIVLTVLSFLVIYFSAYLLALSLGLNITFGLTILVVSLVFIAISLPISLGGHGVREVMMVLLFTTFGVTARGQESATTESAIAFSVLLFALQLFPALLGAIVFATSGRGFKEVRDSLE
jgi:uncharacterized protein (TIRG00374 family)